jgi:uncharacterized protein YcbK (DUF882 family)
MKTRTKLSDNFYLDEFTASNVATQQGIKNTPPDEAVENLAALCVHVLQPTRDSAGKPIRISSGYRCPELNEAVGGVPTSQHVKGEASDIYCEGVKAKDLFTLIQRLGIEFDQLILYPTFVHVSFSEGKNRKEVLYAKGVQP